MSLNNANINRRRGFTVVEMLVIAPIVILTVGAFITAIVSMTGEVLANRSSNVLAYNIQNAMGMIENDIKLSTAFLATNNITPSSPQGFDNATAGFANVDSGTNGNMLILNELATTGNPLNPTTGLIYLTNQPNSCGGVLVSQNNPMKINVIYFVKNGTLWRRTIMPSNYASAGCSTPWQQPSCLTASGFCLTQDFDLVDGITANNFVVQYFNSASTMSANTVASDYTQSAATRTASLQSATTAGVSILVTSSAAGRSVSQSGNIRSTRLDINASSIATVVTPTTPAAPVVTGSIVDPASVLYSWQSVPGATSYTIEQKIDSGTWSTVVPSTTNTSYTVNATRTNVVNLRVTSVNSAGSALSAVSTLTVPPWTPLILNSNWHNYDTLFANAAYTKTSSGVVLLKGLVKISGTFAPGSIIGTLPVGYRPSEQLIFQTSDNQAASRIDIWTNGNISVEVGTGIWDGLDGISFMPSGTSFNLLTPLYNSWVNRSPVDQFYSQPSYMIDGSGRVRVKGFTQGGNSADNTPMFYLPVGARPGQYMHISEDTGNAAGLIGISATDGSVQAKNTGNAWISSQALFFPASYPSSGACTSNWCALTLLSSWVNRVPGTYPPASYTKASDGMVHVKGLIQTGVTTNGTVIANLPAGYRPKERLLLTIAENGTWGRIDIASNGDIVAVTVSSNWTSMDSIYFMAEQ